MCTAALARVPGADQGLDPVVGPAGSNVLAAAGQADLPEGDRSLGVRDQLELLVDPLDQAHPSGELSEGVEQVFLSQADRHVAVRARAGDVAPDLTHLFGDLVSARSVEAGDGLIEILRDLAVEGALGSGDSVPELVGVPFGALAEHHREEGAQEPDREPGQALVVVAEPASILGLDGAMERIVGVCHGSS